MNQKALKVLEYDKIIQLLAEQATSDAGKKRCLELVPMTDKQLITDAQAQTADALSRIYRKGSISFGGLKDPGFQMKRLEIGGCLNAAETTLYLYLTGDHQACKSLFQRKPRQSAG